MKIKRIFKTIGFYLLLTIIVLFISLPLINMVGSSFKSTREILNNNNIFPEVFTWENYRNVLNRTPFLTYVRNSVVVAVLTAVVVGITSCLAGYAIARYQRHIRAFRYFSKLFLILQMFPAVLLMIPLVLVFIKVGLSDSLLGISLIYIAFNIPFCTWMISGFFEGIPVEMEEAAQIDGCTVFQSFCKLAVPLSLPGIASIMIYAFIGAWNEYMMANVINKSAEVKTLPVGLQSFILQFDTDWGSLMAASVLAIIPAMLFIIFMQKYIVAGLTAGAVKG
ncbi:carbohydrate ABC transporter permease [Murimonas intestini]|uniref:Carbohydrate ABC transporter membrane protein 2 (CUT1 family) n=2 Tax=Murimonas intestini TaxID=1337051 RepID=A0AB73T7H8_9FIRM|nr:carbohydrate ABC transporter permease [Murimonas intestini]MCR1841216.1 carbohydrate ABC transporter permease [Murimonas intestini]MCR1866134.1 carbohydrate ABC transporter permease [Murimonas intestini]MCR1882749.1 carbohydrate ABC transporter permease [Murimonas intestini]